MKNNLRVLLIIVLSIFWLVAGQNAYGKKIHNKAYKFKITIPGTMREMNDTVSAGENEQLYFDTSNDVVLIISGRASSFRSVKDYMDCSQEELEQKLQRSFGDTTLVIISCAQSKYYPGKSEVIHFRVADDDSKLNTYLIYFIHTKKEDLQLSFTYQKESEQESIAYVDGIMQTLKLR